MEIYMNMPSIGIPTDKFNAGTEKNAELYEYYYQMHSNVFLAYRQDISEDINTAKLSLRQKRSGFVSPLVSEQIKSSRLDAMDFDYLFDCSSTATVEGPALTYCLAKNIGLPSIKPIALNGQAGTEFAQCLQFLDSDTLFRNAVCVLNQFVSLPDTRQVENGYALADAAVATLLSNKYIAGFSRFKIVSSVLKQYKHISEAVVSAIEKAACHSIDWVIIHNHSESYSTNLLSPLTSRKIHQRKEYGQANFGCGDVFVTLDDLCKKQQIAGQNVLLYMIGRYGTVACIVLEAIIQ